MQTDACTTVGVMHQVLEKWLNTTIPRTPYRSKSFLGMTLCLHMPTKRRLLMCREILSPSPVTETW